ncbi:MAG: hypothetical protein NT070_20865, partial [Cyanobacteria bacterium]|nr:hypothetical protein [Cyanobacteriota bacterium]
FPCLVLPFLTTDTDWQDGQDGLDSDIDLLSNNHLDIFLHPFLFRTTNVPFIYSSPDAQVNF